MNKKIIFLIAFLILFFLIFSIEKIDEIPEGKTLVYFYGFDFDIPLSSCEVNIFFNEKKFMDYILHSKLLIHIKDDKLIMQGGKYIPVYLNAGIKKILIKYTVATAIVGITKRDYKLLVVDLKPGSNIFYRLSFKNDNSLELLVEEVDEKVAITETKNFKMGIVMINGERTNISQALEIK